jgi:hypothetical protein
MIHRRTGLLVPHRNIKAAAKAAARQYANQFDWDKSAEKWKNSNGSPRIIREKE